MIQLQLRSTSPAGILGLPVKLVYSGMAPFVVVFTVTLFMQLAIIWITWCVYLALVVS